MMELKDRITEVIAYSQLTASEFADEIEVQRSSISHIMSGRNKPSLDLLVKIKKRFPELRWDWLIEGEGEMHEKPQEQAAPEQPVKPTSLPELFSLINDEAFGVTESEDKIQSSVSPESDISVQQPAQSQISDSQRLEKSNTHAAEQPVKASERIVKKIVFFYDDGKFESFEP